MHWPIEFVPRNRPAGIWLFITPIIALLGTLCIGAVMFSVLGLPLIEICKSVKPVRLFSPEPPNRRISEPQIFEVWRTHHSKQ